MRQCVRSVHSNAKCPGLRQVVDCTVCRNRVSSVVGRVFWCDVIDMLWALSSRKTRLMMSSMGLPVRTTTAKVLRSGSRRPVRNTSISSSSVGENEVPKVFDNGTYRLCELDGTMLRVPIAEKRVKIFKKRTHEKP